MLRKIWKHISDKILGMPPRILTTEEIITHLNGNAPTGQWVEVQQLNLLPKVSVTGPSIIMGQLNSGLVLKTFINTTTAEIRMFLAKSINIPERPNL